MGNRGGEEDKAFEVIFLKTKTNLNYFVLED